MSSRGEKTPKGKSKKEIEREIKGGKRPGPRPPLMDPPSLDAVEPVLSVTDVAPAAFIVPPTNRFSPMPAPPLQRALAWAGQTQPRWRP